MLFSRGASNAQAQDEAQSQQQAAFSQSFAACMAGKGYTVQ